MKSFLVVALAVSAGLLAAAEAPLALRIPAGVPDGAALGWEKVSGEVETRTERVRYEFYVNPVRAAIYEVARYRMVRLSEREGGPHASAETEKLVWNARPGTGQVPLCFALQGDGVWKALLPGTAAYRGEMGTAMQVFGLHRSAILRPPVD